MSSDAELVVAVLRGERESYAELVRRHERSLMAVAGSILGDLHRTQDAVQETFVTGYQQLGCLRRPEVFGAWARQIARTTALKMVRSAGRTVSLNEGSEPACEHLDGRIDDRTDRVLAAVMKLPGKQRQVVLLRYFDGHALGTIAEMTDQPIGTVKSQLSRAAARLRERLKDLQP